MLKNAKMVEGMSALHLHKMVTAIQVDLPAPVARSGWGGT
jgi:hypothetical protein